jgi:alkanesulfonate monooxygenase SsuD/methylene tetrahydromethanopterin reductase-like flavin-dependent oxidoreductase (luciferase family)
MARTWSSLDHVTEGRIGWNVVTSFNDSGARAMGFDKIIPHDERYERADEFMDVLYEYNSHFSINNWLKLTKSKSLGRQLGRRRAII